MSSIHMRVAVMVTVGVLILALFVGIQAASAAPPSATQGEQVSLSTALDLTKPRVRWHILKWRREFGGKRYDASWKMMSCDRTSDGGAKCPWTGHLHNSSGDVINCSGDSYITSNGHRGRFVGGCVV